MRREGQPGYIQTHRFAYETVSGPIPLGTGYHGVCVLHRCDNPPCCNPAHLYLGTPAQNAEDCVTRQRNKPPHGEDHWWAKLTEADVVEIRERYAAGEKQSTLADKFGVRQAAISRVVSGEHWPHSGGPLTDGRFRRARGEESPSAVVTEATAIEILRRARAGEKKARLASEFGVPRQVVYRLVSRRTWKHLS